MKVTVFPPKIQYTYVTVQNFPNFFFFNIYLLYNYVVFVIMKTHNLVHSLCLNLFSPYFDLE